MNPNFVILLTIAIFNEESILSGAAKPDLRQIKSDILKRYDRMKPPFDDINSFSMLYYFRSILVNYVDEQYGYVEMKTVQLLNWIDPRLNFMDQNDNNSLVHRIWFSEGQLWTPVQHYLNTYYWSLGDFPIAVLSSGQVYNVKIDTVDTFCYFDLTFYPFDRQECDCLISIFDAKGEKLKVTGVLMKHEIEHMMSRPFWSYQISEVSQQSYKNARGFFEQGLRIKLILRRTATTFAFTTIFPVMVCLVVGGLSHLLRPSDGITIRLCLSATTAIILACVNLVFQHYGPHVGSTTPILYILCDLSLWILLLSGAETVLTSVILRQPEYKTISSFIGSIPSKLVLRIWGWSSAEDNSTDDTNDCNRLVADTDHAEEEDSEIINVTGLTSFPILEKETASINEKLVLIIDFLFFLLFQSYILSFSIFIAVI